MVNSKNKVSFITLGCKVNQYETNAMMQRFVESGYEINDENADIYIINTCTVTNMSDRKSRQMLRRMKQKNPNSIVVAVGCYVQVAKEELEKQEYIDLVFGNVEKKDIVALVEKYQKSAITQDLMKKKEYDDFGTITYTEKVRAAVKIQDGCDRFCSYCIIPYARGRVRSRKSESVINEIKAIVGKGIKEVVLTGIHIASYGKDFKNEYKLIDLIEDIDKIEGLERIRLGSIEPLIITDEFIQRMHKLNKVCDHFHLSLQSGCDDTLKRMNRRYTTVQFEIIVNRIRNIFENALITTDIIVGFPGETDEEFNKTFEYLSTIKLYKMHIFKYSTRKGTVASIMKKQVDGNIKEERSKKLLELSDSIQNEYNKKIKKGIVDVLFEEKKENVWIGHTTNFVKVGIVTQDNLENKIVEIKNWDNVKIINS